jgi:hypothetical protein
MTITLRLLSIIIVTGALTGCADYKKLALLEENLSLAPCPAPSFPTPYPCYYELTVTSINGNTAKARIPKQAVERTQKGCENLRGSVYSPIHPCPDATNYPNHEYEIRLVPGTIQGPGTYLFVADNGTGLLKLAPSVSPAEKAPRKE